MIMIWEMMEQAERADDREKAEVGDNDDAVEKMELYGRMTAPPFSPGDNREYE